MPGRIDDLGVPKANPPVLLCEVGGCAPDVAGALGLARDAGDPEEVFELAEAPARASLREILQALPPDVILGNAQLFPPHESRYALPRLRGGPVGPRERGFSARRAFETVGVAALLSR